MNMPSVDFCTWVYMACSVLDVVLNFWCSGTHCPFGAEGPEVVGNSVSAPGGPRRGSLDSCHTSIPGGQPEAGAWVSAGA